MNDILPPDDRQSAPSSSSSRRSFLTRAAVISIVPASIGLFWSQQRHKAADAGALKGATAKGALRLDHFLPFVDSSFASPEPSVPPLTLSKAEAGKRHQPEIAEHFSLRFSAPEGYHFESRIYQLEHPVLGPLEIFITPVGSAALFGGQQKGEAVFNHSRAVA